MRVERLRVIVGTLLMFVISGVLTFVFASANTSVPVSLKLRLGKDTLAMAEATYLKAEITNNTDKDLLLDNRLMFLLANPPYRFSLYLIMPSGEECLYQGFRGVDVLGPVRPHHFFLLPPGVKASKGILLWWSIFLPREYEVALEKLPPGTYKLFVTYRLPETADQEKIVIYSDTVEFVFLPPKSEHHHALVEMDSLYRFFGSIGAAKGRIGLQAIKESNTPYSEAAHARLLTWVRDLDSFTLEKANFDSLYPSSQFSTHLLETQYKYAKTANRTNVLDSLNRLLLEIEPSNTDALLRQGVIRHPATLEDLR